MSIQPDEKAPKINMKNGEFYDEHLFKQTDYIRHGMTS